MIRICKNKQSDGFPADRYTYRRFLRARQHDLTRATEMWLAHLQWRKESGADTILTDFEFPERDAFISLYPQGYCNVDKMVRDVILRNTHFECCAVA